MMFRNCELMANPPLSHVVEAVGVEIFSSTTFLRKLYAEVSGRRNERLSTPPKKRGWRKSDNPCGVNGFCSYASDIAAELSTSQFDTKLEVIDLSVWGAERLSWATDVFNACSINLINRLANEMWFGKSTPRH